MINTLCPICNGKKITVKILLSKLILLQCASCYIVFVSKQSIKKQTKDYFEDFSLKDYIAYYKPFRMKIFKNNWRYISHVIPGGKAVDLGASFGWFEQCAPKSWKVTSIEKSKETSAYAKASGIHIVTGDEKTLKKKISYYDLITLHNVFEHLPNPIESLAVFNSALKSKGILVLSLPNRDGLINRLAILLAHIHIFQPVYTLFQVESSSPHLFYYNAKNITNILRRKGFKVIDIQPQPVVDINNLDKRILLENKKNAYTHWIKKIATILSYYASVVLHMQDEMVIYAMKEK